MSAAKTLVRAHNNPANVRFADLLTLVEALGYVERRRADGSHRLFKHPVTGHVLNLQPRRDGKAKAYQVRQLLAAVAAHDLKVGNDA